MRSGGDAPTGRARPAEATDLETAEVMPAVLVVDESPMVLEVVERMLSRRRYPCRSARSAREAMDVIDRDGDDIDVLLIDVTTARPASHQDGSADGDGLLERTRRTWPRMRILCMAASGGGGTDLAVTPLLRKPFGPDELYGALDELSRS